MPELPEVECVVRGLRSSVKNSSVSNITVRRTDLRIPLPKAKLKKILQGHLLTSFRRRSKYILIEGKQEQTVVIHLGMSGHLLLSSNKNSGLKHTHMSIEVSSEDKTRYLHFVDPRRFGLVTVVGTNNLDSHKLFSHLGPEPLDCANLSQHLYQRSRNKKVAVKTFVMNAKNVVGVGNIYASESLHKSGLHPLNAAGSLTQKQWQTLSRHIKATLKAAIKAGGTTLQDYSSIDGQPGYFAQKLWAYGRSGDECRKCKVNNIEKIVIANRASFFCASCQPHS